MAFGNIAGRAAFILDLDKSALDTGLPKAERQFEQSTTRMQKATAGMGAAAERAGTAFGGGGGGVGLVGRMGLVGAAVNVAFQGFQHLQAGLRVTGAAAGETEGRMRNLGAELMTGDIVGGIKALRTESYATDKQLAEMAVSAQDAAGRLDLIEASAAASSIGLGKLAGQIDAVVAAALKIDPTTFKFDMNAQFGDNPAAVSGQKTFGVTPLAEAQQTGVDLRNETAAEIRAALDENAPSTIVNRVNKAALTQGLTDDLEAATAQEAYFATRLRGVKTGSARYTTILASLKQAHSARQSIVDQISAAEKAADATAAAKAKQAAAERKAAADAAARAAEEAKAEEARRLRAGLTLREDKLRNNLAAAELTKKTVEDDKRALRKLIAFDAAQERNKRLSLSEREGFRTKKLQDRKALADLNTPKADEKKKTAATAQQDFARLSFEFLQSMRGINNQYGANFSGGVDANGRITVHELRKQTEHLASLTAGQRNPEARYGRLEADTAMQASF